MAKRNLDLSNLPSNNETLPNEPTPRRVASGKTSSSNNGVLGMFRDITNGLFDEMVLPAVKNIVVEAFSSGINRAVFGGGEYGGRDRRGTSRHMSYHTAYEKRRVARPREDEIFEDIYYPTHVDADRVLDSMLDYIREYGMVMVSDFFIFSGLDAPYSARNYGWKDLRGVRIERAGSEYIIGLPRPVYIRR